MVKDVRIGRICGRKWSRGRYKEMQKDKSIVHPQKPDTVSVRCHPERRRRSCHQPPVNAQIVLHHPRHAKPFFKDLPTACTV